MNSKIIFTFITVFSVIAAQQPPRKRQKIKKEPDHFVGGEIPKSAKDLLWQFTNFDRLTVRRLPIARVILLYGTIGTGKTCLAKEFAKALGVRPSIISGNDLLEYTITGKDKQLKWQELLEYIKKIFDSEQRKIRKRKGKVGLIIFDKLYLLLNAMIYAKEPVDPELILDLINRKAKEKTPIISILEHRYRPLWMKPHCDEIIKMQLPDNQNREKILAFWAAQQPLSLDKNVSLKRIAFLTRRKSGADLKRIIEKALLKAIREDKKTIQQDHLEQSAELVIHDGNEPDKEHESLYT